MKVGSLMAGEAEGSAETEMQLLLPTQVQGSDHGGETSSVDKSSDLKLSEEKMYSCGSCKHKTKCRSDKVRHTRININEKLFKCNLCDYTTAQKGSLVRHSRIHTNS